MEYVVTGKIIPHKVLNDDSGDLETKYFKETETRKNIKGGYTRMYKDYDKVLLACTKSQTDLSIILHIRDKFTYNKIETALVAIDIAETFSVSRQKISTLINQLVNEQFIMKVDKRNYRLNPYMYLPYRSDAELLQREWNELCRIKVKEILEEDTDDTVDRGILTQDYIVATLGKDGFMKLIAAGMKASTSMEEKWNIYDKVKETHES